MATEKNKVLVKARRGLRSYKQVVECWHSFLCDFRNCPHLRVLPLSTFNSPQRSLDDAVTRIAHSRDQMMSCADKSPDSEALRVHINIPLINFIAERFNDVQVDRFPDDWHHIKSQWCFFMHRTLELIDIRELMHNCPPLVTHPVATLLGLKQDILNQLQSCQSSTAELEQHSGVSRSQFFDIYHRRSPRQCGQCHVGANALWLPLRRCSVCKRVYYCSVECQHLHWAVHKGNCLSDNNFKMRF